ncbi:MAG: Copper-translocating P-type ATPase [Candidatus Falkowbacteria bacterium GW2011_GWC2_38_22]|uniref:Copper-translocating P-type ATPase n=1 Tax=Candidatus Falkowbacteria bacterium GW2011_GWE1_38_31 TaxID=1618638 RepID=A0A0G0N0C6_9BACT|nr:MAG: Copper-translocating P-type ATPase [Candidatus Falkowbacteria bacterium GW2011_GWF2_38_1205]KKQ61682.1 MAG: Copper-translocating P-type ATPase [Candidatus Falkowbacteria bacterium GW2011_GWC2_38_22]KKQ63703.1 MAG: Copper-translocating P-type ATPase [Candidatus Falkowbacteria bacterium GW2011_GWF1_38_22]KKQ65881.1 MAG: Copper-translocating P-type ATPase [Candidatus Falkowbacteria bacterium GW2011_GWE2_38_254]KKQ70566.1 MAG: Copper-translocating P-type ATPase [Candidatus Falkowbacteria ba
MISTKLNIAGMHCASCASNIKIALEKEKAVKSATVNFALKNAEVVYDEKNLTLDQIKDIIQKTGYTVIENNEIEKSEILAAKADAALKLKTILALILSAPLIVSMFWMYKIPGSFLGVMSTHWLHHNLAFIVVFILGWQFHANAWRALMNKQSDMDTLISVGTLSAYFFSVYAMFTGGDIYFEGAATITALILLGRYMELKTKNRSMSALKKLMELGVKSATIINENGKEEKRDLKEINIGDTLLIRPGDKIPLDGIITSGSTTIDESMLTGEAIPVTKENGQEVFAATINLDGIIKIKVNKNGEDTVYSQIIKSVEDAQKYKAPIQKLADKIAAIFVPVVIVIAALTFIFTWLVVGDVGVAVLRAISVLIISCPCALGIATPIAILVGSSVGAKNGILIKNGESFEKAQNITTAVFDKTGTLTLGKPEIKEIISTNDSIYSNDKILKLAKSLAKNSSHPLSQAINNYEAKIELAEIDNFLEISGHGLTGTCKTHGTQILLGNYKLLKEKSVSREWAKTLVEKYKESEYTILFVGHGIEIAGAILLADKIKENSRAALDAIKNLGIRSVIISGDNKNSVATVANNLGVTDYLAEVLPNKKQAEVKKIQSQNEKVLFAGDGINDAPALVQADLGIAMASGTDIAKEAGDIVILKNDPEKIVFAIRLSRLTFSIIKQNLFWAFFYNTIAIPFAVFGLVSPMVAALAMGLSDVTVIGNALRIYRIRK